MNRFKKAWMALTDRLEPEIKEVEVVRTVERPVIGEPMIVTLYEAQENRWVHRRPEWSGHKFLSCEQAHSECPGANVVASRAIRVGGIYFSAYEVTEVQPKPKRAKGRAA